MYTDVSFPGFRADQLPPEVEPSEVEVVGDDIPVEIERGPVGTIEVDLHSPDAVSDVGGPGEFDSEGSSAGVATVSDLLGEATDSPSDPDAIPRTEGLFSPQRSADEPQPTQKYGGAVIHADTSRDEGESPEEGLRLPEPPASARGSADVPASSPELAADSGAGGHPPELPEVVGGAADEGPLFEFIEGPESKERGDGPVPYLPPAETLAPFDLPPRLVAETEELATQVAPIAQLGMARMPEGRQRRDYEGRGGYHEVVVDGRKITVYVKGSGSPDALDDPSREYPGYPAQPEGMLHDDITGPQSRPRIKGTLTDSAAGLEQATAATIFAGRAQQEGWQGLDDVFEHGGVTLPLGAYSLPGLSRRMEQLAERYMQEGSNPLWKEALRRWGTRSNVATTALAVPSNERIVGGIDNPRIIQTAPYSAYEGGTIGKTLRRLMQLGFVYGYGSAHLQNIYHFGDPAQADGQDLEAIADFSSRPVSRELQDRFHTHPELPGDSVRIALMYMQLERGQLTPRFSPDVESGTNWEATLEPAANFWRELLGGIADPRAIERIPHLAPHMHREFELAAAILLHDRADHTVWEELAEGRRQIIANADPRYNLPAAHAHRVETTLSDEFAAAVDWAMYDESHGMETVLEFLRTGDENVLYNHEIFGEMLHLQNAIERIEDTGQRDQMLRLIGAPGMDYEMRNGDQAQPIMNEFRSRHRQIITELLNQVAVDRAILLTTILYTASLPHTRRDLALGGAGEEVGHHYARRALTETNNPWEVLDQAQFDTKLGLFTHLMWGGAQNPPETPSMEDKQAAFARLQDGSYDMADYTLLYDLPSPDIVTRWVSSDILTHPAERRQATEWIDAYLQTQRAFQILDEGTRAQEAPQFIEMLDRLFLPGSQEMAEFLTNHPELNMMHNAWAAHQLAALHPDRAREYFVQVVDYYHDVLPDRRHIGTADPYVVAGVVPPSESNPRWQNMVYGDRMYPAGPWENGAEERLAEQYAEERLEQIGNYYRDRAERQP